MAKVHNDEFKREAVRIALTSGLPRRQVASDLGVGFSTLAKRMQRSRPGDLPPAADIDLAKGNERLRKENRLLTEERELLKKATVFFAGLSKFTFATFAPHAKSLKGLVEPGGIEPPTSCMPCKRSPN
jgi:transposase